MLLDDRSPMARIPHETGIAKLAIELMNDHQPSPLRWRWRRAHHYRRLDSSAVCSMSCGWFRTDDYHTLAAQ
jgi:hypothetical protein